MDEVRRLLHRAQCLKYAEKFAEHGYDSAGHLLSMGPSDFEEVRQQCEMLPDHMNQMWHTVTACRCVFRV